uniref:Uncharacterized protein n=1 Tax=Lepeophtheirus salmonis TaxID=72036 RepID=A0A0K2V5R2_LEPSM
MSLFPNLLQFPYLFYSRPQR